MPRAIHVLNGPNLNRLGKREPEVYGHTTLEEIEALCRSAAGDAEVVFRQTNYEGQLVDWIHEATDGGADGIIINPAGLSFQSIPVLDALKMCACPIVEVHISNIHRRDESWRAHSLMTGAVTGMITGLGPQGYALAVRYLAAQLAA